MKLNEAIKNIVNATQQELSMDRAAQIITDKNAKMNEEGDHDLIEAHESVNQAVDSKNLIPGSMVKIKDYDENWVVVSANNDKVRVFSVYDYPEDRKIVTFPIKNIVKVLAKKYNMDEAVDSHMIKPNEYGNINIPDSGYIKNVVVNGKRLTARQFAFNPKTSTLVIDGNVFSKQLK